MAPDLGTVAAGVAALGGIAAFARWVWPKWREFGRKVDAGLTAVIGHDEIRDPANGRLLARARPGLGVWMATADDALATLSTAVGALAEQHMRLDDHEHRLTRNEHRINQLEAGIIERIAARVDSTAAFDAIKAAHESTPPHDEPEG